MTGHKGSVLFAGQAYYNAWYLSRALRKLGWKADVLNWDQSETDQNFYHGEDIKFTNGSNEEIAEQIKFYENALHTYDIFHFSNTRCMTFGQVIKTWVPINYPGFDEISLLKHLGKKITYSHNGCHDGVKLSTFRNLGTTEQPTCNICPWVNNPTICSDELSIEWGKFRNSMADYQCLLGGNNHDFNINPHVHETPEFYCLDSELWHPDIIVPEKFRLNHPDGTVKIYHAVGNYDARTSSDGVNLKSSHIYLPLLKFFKAIGYPVELIFAKGIPNYDVRFLQVQADIVVDMLTFGFFGANVREAMMLGKTTVCYLRPEWLESMRREIPEYVDELPVVNATPGTIHKVLMDLIEHPEKRAEIGRKSREFALKWHSAEAGARRFDQIYSALLNNSEPPLHRGSHQLPIDQPASPQSFKTKVDNYWSEHTVNSIPFSSAKESLEYLDFRFEEYPLFREFMELYGKHDGEVVLDYGCGPGNDVVGFLAHTNASKVIGIDVSEKALNLARHRLSLHDFNEGRFQLIKVSDSSPSIPLPDGSVDYIYCEGVLHHTSDPLAILKEFYRILKPSGTACIMVYNRNSIWFHLYTAYYKMLLENKFSGMSVEDAFQRNTDGEFCPIARCYLPEEFNALCSSAGFNSNYRGGYLSKTELVMMAQHRESAINSPHLPSVHRNFISLLETGVDGFPMFEGKHAGIGGVYSLQKTEIRSSSRVAVPLNTNKLTSDATHRDKTIVMFVHDSRIDRRVLDQARSLNSAGWKVTVIAGPPPSEGDRYDEESYPDVEIIRVKPTKGTLLSLITSTQKIDLDRVREILGYFLNFDFQESFYHSDAFLLEALNRPAAVYVAHDLPQLPAALIGATYHTSHLVYDSHELFSEQTFNCLEKNHVYSMIESLLVPFTDLVTTVNESIAQEMAHRYGIRKPDVILNAPLCNPNQFTSDKTDLLRRNCGIPRETRILLFQGGMVRNSRNLENLVAAMGLLELRDVALVLMGPAEASVLKELQQIALTYNILNSRVFFHKSVPQNDLLFYTSSADAGVIPYPAIDLNTYLCTPNKLFEFIVSGLPILANDLPELNRFVSEQGIGLNLPMATPQQIANAIDSFFCSDIGRYRTAVASLHEKFTWHTQGEKVVQRYEQLLKVTSRQSQLREGRMALEQGNIAQARKSLDSALGENRMNPLLLNELCKLETLVGESSLAGAYSSLVAQANEQMRLYAETSGTFSFNMNANQVPRMLSSKLKLLVVLHYPVQDPPMRSTIRDHIQCFERYSQHTVRYLNLWYCEDVPPAIVSTSYDLIIFHTVFLSARWSPDNFSRLMKLPGLQALCNSSAIKIAIPQDEFLHTDVLCDFIGSFNIQHVFSVAPESEWPAIYHKLDPSVVRFHMVLTGYLDDDTVTRIQSFSRETPFRNVDIGYRAWRAAYWLGRHGQLKYQIADFFKLSAPQHGFTVDISTDDKHTFLDDDWYRFMLRCKYFIGVEGGASIHDRDGRIKMRTENYLKEYPDASFEEVESVCFPGIDGSFRLYALSPRNLEACATKTCQVLIEGDYNGILQPWLHYIPLKKDLSNIEEVFSAMRDDSIRETIVERAYQDIVASGKYSYQSFVSYVLDTALSSR